MKRIINERWRNYNFQYMTKHAGKGMKNSLKLLKIVNDDGEIIKIIMARKEIEEKLIKFNRSHYQKANETKVCQDKIHRKLGDNIIRDKILNGQLER